MQPYGSQLAAIEVWNKWYCWAQRCRLEPMKDVARRLCVRLYNILTFIAEPQHRADRRRRDRFLGEWNWWIAQ